jgi:HSP20 family molecular chaperone IbpA
MGTLLKKKDKAEVEEKAQAQAYWDVEPAVDLMEFEDGFKLIADLPGVSASGLTVDVDSGMLNITGVSDMVRNEKTVRYRRSYKLSNDLDVAGISATEKNGVLELVVPKAAVAKVHKIKVLEG